MQSDQEAIQLCDSNNNEYRSSGCQTACNCLLGTNVDLHTLCGDTVMQLDCTSAAPHMQECQGLPIPGAAGGPAAGPQGCAGHAAVPRSRARAGAVCGVGRRPSQPHPVHGKASSALPSQPCCAYTSYHTQTHGSTRRSLLVITGCSVAHRRQRWKGLLECCHLSVSTHCAAGRQPCKRSQPRHDRWPAADAEAGAGAQGASAGQRAGGLLCQSSSPCLAGRGGGRAAAIPHTTVSL